MNVLIRSAGRRVSLLRAFRAEVERVSSGQVFASDMEPGLSAACHIADRSFSVPGAQDEAFVPSLLDLCRSNDVCLLVPTIDTELQILADHRGQFSAIGTVVAVSDPEFVRICRDKRRTAEFFRARGIETPTSIEKSAPTFPLFVKPYDGSLSSDTYVVRHSGELTDYHLANDRLLFMEYLSPETHDEFTVDMFYTESGDLACAVPRKRLAVRAGEISKGLTKKGPLLDLLVAKLGHIPGVRGCLTAQFFVNCLSGRITGIEINPRFGGGFPLTYRAGGNYPAWLIEECLGCPTRSYTADWREDLLMLRYDDEVFVDAS